MRIEKRGTYTKVEDLINPSVVNTAHPYLFDLKNAPELLLKSMLNGQPIAIFGDYDVDGVCGCAISYRGFNRFKEMLVAYKNEQTRRAMPTAVTQHLLKLTQNAFQCDKTKAHEILCNENNASAVRVRVRIPHRYTEGYGMKESMVDEVSSGVLFTVDNGIAAATAIQKANAKGLTTIVTDHHSMPVVKSTQVVNGEAVEVNQHIMPAAHCLINPHVEEAMNEPGHYDFYDYCGASVALKVIESLIEPDKRMVNECYAFAAIATVADVMPMIEDNRNIFNRGIEAIKNRQITPGLAALLEVSKINVKHLPDNLPTHTLITSDTMGFTIGPKINAAGRVGTSHPSSMGGDRGAERALRCLLATDYRMAKDLAMELHEANENRKAISKEMQMKCEVIIEQNGMQNDCPLVVHIPECGAGVIGLIAGYLCEKYQVPAIVFNGEGDHCKGSARSPEGMNIKEMLDECQDLLLAYGGHPGAAGITISEESIDKLRNALYNVCQERGYTSLRTDTIPYDLEIDAKDIQHNLDVLTNKLAPFGLKNQEPVFLVRNFQIKDVVVLGEKHLKLMGNGASAIGFFLAEDSAIMNHIDSVNRCDMLGTISYNCFRGNGTPQLSIQEIVLGDEIIRDEHDDIELEEEVK